MKTIVRIDGKDHETETGSADHLGLIARADAWRDSVLAAEKARADKATADLDKVTARADAADVKIKALETQVAELPAKLTAASAARAELETKARAILGAEYKFDGKDERTVRVDAIRKIDPEFKDEGRSADYLAARFDGLTAPSPSVEFVNKFDRDDHRAVREDFDYDKHVAAANAKARDAWKTPVKDSN